MFCSLSGTTLQVVLLRLHARPCAAVTPGGNGILGRKDKGFWYKLKLLTAKSLQQLSLTPQVEWLAL